MPLLTAIGTFASVATDPNALAFYEAYMFFVQTNAPTGWVKVTDFNDQALKVTNGAITEGGNINFTSAMTTYTIPGTATLSGTAVGGTTISVAQLPSHNHSPHFVSQAGIGKGTPNPSSPVIRISTSGSTTGTFSPTSWTGGPHSHSVSNNNQTSNISVNMSVRYVDVILAKRVEL